MDFVRKCNFRKAYEDISPIAKRQRIGGPNRIGGPTYPLFGQKLKRIEPYGWKGGQVTTRRKWKFQEKEEHELRIEKNISFCESEEDKKFIEECIDDLSIVQAEIELEIDDREFDLCSLIKKTADISVGVSQI